MNNIKTATVAACFSVTAKIIIHNLIESGTKVVAFGRKGDDVRAKKMEDKYPGMLTVLLGDLADETESKALTAKAVGILGNIEAHYHCTGIFTWRYWKDIEVKEVEDIFSANFMTAFVFGREIFNAMALSGGGSIMFVSARDTVRNIPAGFGPYMASKLALNGLVESMAAEGSQHNININAILPTIVNTQVNRDAMPDADHSTWVDPAEMAELMIELTQPTKTNLSGSLIAFNGKMH
ncbi:SDR family NAD(P)-dependent oxidoreductase [Moritella sp. F3]|uniref:SDR family NAD(P)-dependent oxidoreductase n=1 Tax=Moritella sp. F3 TaxID=2718882 RepID=UPI0018E16BD2|nr:SDR family NAD(P)-dependent oxidoreductase [Moritella sp. F3]GIC76666.1 glucose 1-dehydrogenase [Moritella sp. F1]GIC80317.1 glucose 1-dehydrogenase [Moritella sp. F3]